MVPEKLARNGAAFQLNLIGGFELHRDGAAQDLPETAKRVVAFLGLHQKPQVRPYVAGSLWPDKPESRAAANLRSALWRLNQPQVPPIVSGDGMTLWLHEAVRVDVRWVQDARLGPPRARPHPGRRWRAADRWSGGRQGPTVRRAATRMVRGLGPPRAGTAGGVAVASSRSCGPGPGGRGALSPGHRHRPADGGPRSVPRTQSAGARRRVPGRGQSRPGPPAARDLRRAAADVVRLHVRHQLRRPLRADGPSKRSAEESSERLPRRCPWAAWAAEIPRSPVICTTGATSCSKERGRCRPACRAAPPGCHERAQDGGSRWRRPSERSSSARANSVRVTKPMT